MYRYFGNTYFKTKFFGVFFGTTQHSSVSIISSSLLLHHGGVYKYLGGLCVRIRLLKVPGSIVLADKVATWVHPDCMLTIHILCK